MRPILLTFAEVHKYKNLPHISWSHSRDAGIQVTHDVLVTNKVFLQEHTDVSISRWLCVESWDTKSKVFFGGSKAKLLWEIWGRGYYSILSLLCHLKACSSLKSISDGKQDQTAHIMWKCELLSKVGLSKCCIQIRSRAVCLFNVCTRLLFCNWTTISFLPECFLGIKEQNVSK